LNSPLKELGKLFLSGKIGAIMGEEKRRCMICGKAMAIKGAICDPCQERIHREARGQQADVRGQAEKELKKHGVNPEPGTKQK